MNEVIKESIDKLNRVEKRIYDVTEEPIRIDDICEELDYICEIINSAKVSLMDNKEKTELDIYKQKFKEYLKYQVEVYERCKKEAKEKLVDEATHDYINAKAIAQKIDNYKYCEHHLECYREILDILEELDRRQNE